MDDQIKNVEDTYGSHILNYAEFSHYSGDAQTLVLISETLMAYSAVFEQEDVDLSIATAIFIVERSEQLPQYQNNEDFYNAMLDHIIGWCQIRFKKWRILPKRSASDYEKEIDRIYRYIKNEYN